MYGGLICLLVLTSAQWCYGSSRLEEWEVTLHHGIEKRRGGRPIVDPPRHTAGYMNLSNTHGARLFYYYAQDRKKNPDAPLLFWTNGGPGGSAMDGAFGNYGPFDVTGKLKLKYSKWGWDKGQNVLFVDQPVGVGFSYSTDSRDKVRWGERVGEDMLAFFLQFMEAHPELRERELFLTGISYAGHYVPSIAAAILESNEERKNIHLNLAGVLLGNPAMNAVYLYDSMPTYAYENRLLSLEKATDIASHLSECIEKGRICNWKDTLDDDQYNRCVEAFDYCERIIQHPIEEENPGLNIYNIALVNTQHGSSNKGKEMKGEDTLQIYLNLPEVQKQIGVHKKWRLLNHTVFNNMKGDIMRDMTSDIVTLLNNDIRFMVFSGDRDLLVNWLGTKAMLADMQWDSSSTWRDELRSWSLNMSDLDQYSSGILTVGACEVLEPLTNCVLFNEGHTVSPDFAYWTMRTFVYGDVFVLSDDSTSSQEPELSSKEIFDAT